MKILIAYEESQVVTKAFRDKGHEAYSCDILETSGNNPEWHFNYDIRRVFHQSGKWDMLIAFPPCTYICGSGWFRSTKDPERMRKSMEAIDSIKYIWGQDIGKICLENPVGMINTFTNLPKPQYIQPHWFGHDASKKTGLWLKGLSELRRTEQIPPRIVEINGKKYKRWGNQTDSGQNKLGPSKNRALIRSKTYPGIADAMAEQWG
jgi:hypothetical protein